MNLFTIRNDVAHVRHPFCFAGVELNDYACASLKLCRCSVRIKESNTIDVVSLRRRGCGGVIFLCTTLQCLCTTLQYLCTTSQCLCTTLQCLCTTLQCLCTTSLNICATSQVICTTSLCTTSQDIIRFTLSFLRVFFFLLRTAKYC